MTDHALERLSERFPDRDAHATLTELCEAITSGTVLQRHEDIKAGECVLEVWLRDGTVIFPAMADNGAVKTVLTEGMSHQTPTGAVTLVRTVLEPGFHHFIAEDRYHADHLRAEPSLSSTLARKLVTQSPLHVWTAHPRMNPDLEPTTKKTFDVGKAAHACILQGRSNWAVFPDDVLASNGAASTKAAKEWEADVRAKGLVPLKADQENDILAMSAKLDATLSALNVSFSPDDAEVVAIAEIDGATCRAMVDQAPADPSLPLYDLKTCEDASPEACLRSVMNYGYDIQARHYLDVWRAATGEDRAFRFVFQEKTAPYEVCVIELSSLDLELAAMKTERARQIWKLCLEQGHWPGYPRNVHTLEVPEFYHAKFTARKAEQDARRSATGKDVYAKTASFQAPFPTPDNTISATEIFGD
ncbi:hypothetical protein GCM10007385_35140 [Tateyamaria omphalii]|uniref:PD-(D/E)XK nuclease-like domain-containing protein n=1 Tax=Tateyamaria omphalii TaxID=299262 RepID=UPI001675557B|nr:PD-(D/E)XK nuclease-like domain-containing protein [Tateyamaria omphalii]GGX62986.1 hypothetical protein GCM10007385_35140 [Tateyamaria omphalii]